MAGYKKGEPANRSKAVKKRSYASRTPQARSYKTSGRVSESGMALGTIARTAVKAASKGNRKYKKKEIPNPVTGDYMTRTKGRARAQAQFSRAQKQRIKSAIKTGEIKQPTGRPRKGYGAMGPVSSRMTKAPVKPSKARRGPSNPKRRKR